MSHHATSRRLCVLLGTVVLAGANDAPRTGVFSKTLTFTLSTTQP